MTIDELIIELQRRREMHGPETVVRVTWEGQAIEIDRSNVYFDKEGLWIDADGNFYRPKDAI